MKKLGFTLSEVVISLAVISVIAAITAPLLGSVIPDKDKVKVLKVHKTLTDINTQLLDNKGAYFPDSDCQGLGCTNEVLNSGLKVDANKIYSGDTKYLSLATDRLEIVGSTTIDTTNNKANFTTIDGITWELKVSNKSKKKFEHELIVDLGEGDNVSFSGTNQTNIDRFIFNIDTYGNVTGGDELTKAYLANPHKLNDKKNDYATAKAKLSKK